MDFKGEVLFRNMLDLPQVSHRRIVDNLDCRHLQEKEQCYRCTLSLSPIYTGLLSSEHYELALIFWYQLFCELFCYQSIHLLTEKASVLLSQPPLHFMVGRHSDRMASRIKHVMIIGKTTNPSASSDLTNLHLRNLHMAGMIRPPC